MPVLILSIAFYIAHISTILLFFVLVKTKDLADEIIFIIPNPMSFVRIEVSSDVSTEMSQLEFLPVNINGLSVRIQVFKEYLAWFIPFG